MRRILLITALAFVVTQGAVVADSTSQSKKELKIKKGSIGVLHIQKENDSSYEVEIIFPYQELTPKADADALVQTTWGAEKEFPFIIPKSNYSIGFEGPAILFDDQGTIGEIHTGLSGMALDFWCENDGGRQFRPSLKMTVKKTNLQRNMRAMSYYDGIAGFVGVGSETDFQPLSKPFKEVKKGDGEYPEFFEHLVMKGRLSKGSHPVARLTETFAEAGCGSDTEQINSLDLEMEGQEYSAALRCCGP